MINNNIRNLLKTKKITQNSFSKQLGLSLRGLEAKLMGERKFKVEEVIKIKKLLNVTYEQILEGDE